MAKFNKGDLVVLISGSMRMAVEGADGEQVACVWCHEGEIFREVFDEALLNKWEFREGPRDGDGGGRGKPGGGRPYEGDRKGGGKPYKGDRDRGDRDRGDRDRGDRDRGGHRGQGGDRSGGGSWGDKPKGKTGWDGKPREKKHFRSDD